MKTLHRIIKNSLYKKKRLPESNLSCDAGGLRAISIYALIYIGLVNQ